MTRAQIEQKGLMEAIEAELEKYNIALAAAMLVDCDY
jgi:hypothetical protein